MLNAPTQGNISSIRARRQDSQSQVQRIQHLKESIANTEKSLLDSTNSIKRVLTFDPTEYDLKGITRQELCDLKEAFDLFDEDGNETIDPTEIMNAMKDLAVTLDKDVISEFFENKEEISFRDMIELMSVETDIHTKSEVENIFYFFDVEKKGYITVDSLRQVAMDLGKDEEEGTLEEMINSIDSKGNGRVYKDDFLNVFYKKSRKHLER